MLGFFVCPKRASVSVRQSERAGRPVQLTSSLVDAQHPSTLARVDSSVGYYPSGALRKVTLGNGLAETAAYNNRLQPCRMNVNSAGGYYSQCTDAVPSGNVLDFKYGFNAGTNNGDITSWSATGKQTFSRTYTYDSLNRIATMADSAKSQSCKGLSWTIDRWGNRTGQTVTSGKCQTFHQTVNSQNQFPLPFRYDAAGNMINDGTHSYTYDAENRLIQVDGGATATYTYDPEGRRVGKAISGTTTDYVHDLAGNVLFEAQGSSWVTTYIYFAGALHAQYKNSTTYFLHRDHLGSTRLVTGLGGTTVDNLDYLPFGEQISGGTSTTHKFTSQERDAETALDNFLARQMGSPQGRFLSPDPDNVGAILTNPQSWNGYSYAWNNPLMFVDPTGTETAVYQLGGSCFSYTYDWYTNDANGLTVHNSTDLFGDCSGYGTATYVNQSYNQSATYQLAAIIRDAITTGRLNQCQGLANYADAAQEVAGSSGLLNAMSLLTPNSAPGQSLLGVRAAGTGLGTPQSSSGFLPQYQNSAPDSPATATSPAWNGDQTHHFAAFFQLGFSHPVASALLPTPFLFEAAEAARGRTGINQGDVNLGAAAQQMGQDVRRGTLSGDQLGNAIRGQLCGK